MPTEAEINAAAIALHADRGKHAEFWRLTPYLQRQYIREARAALEAAEQERRQSPQWPEITKEQVAAIDKIVAPEFATGDWKTVEKE